MKSKHLFFILFVVALVWSGAAYFQGHEGLAALLLLMALASVLNTSGSEANKPASMRALVNLVLPPK